MSTFTKRRRKLDEIYANIPSVACKGLCVQACAMIPVFPAEIERIERAVKRPLQVLLEGPELGRAKALATSVTNVRCPLLVANRCSVYGDRPFICRIFGVADGLPCPHGCAPDRVFTLKEIQASIDKLEKL